MKKIIIIGCITTLKIVFSEPQMLVIKAIGDKLIQQCAEKTVRKTHAFTHALSEAPGYSFANSNLAQTLLSNPFIAIFQAKQALKKHEHNFDALLTLGIAYRKTGQFERAIASLKKVIDWSHISNEHRQTNRVGTACRQLAMVYSDLDQLDYATFYYKRALAFDKTDLWAANNLAYIFYNKGNYKKAQEVFESYIDNNPYKPFASLAYAFMLRKMNNHHEYEQCLKQASKRFELLFECMPTFVPVEYVKKHLLETWSYVQHVESDASSRSKETEQKVLQTIVTLIKQKLPELLPDKPQEKLSQTPSETFDSVPEYPPDSPDLEINGEVNSDEEFNSPYG